jgi:uncharacterized membrane protein YbhN (UPF0104 family)
VLQHASAFGIDQRSPLPGCGAQEAFQLPGAGETGAEQHPDATLAVTSETDRSEARVTMAAGSSARSPPPRHHQTLRAGERWLWKAVLRLLGYGIAAYLVIRLIPALREALEYLERPSWWWVAIVVVLEIISEIGFVISWHAIVDPESRLGEDGRGRIDLRLAWVQLGAGMFVPGGSLSSVGVGAWLLHRFGMPLHLVVERQLTLSLLNTAIDAIALVAIGIALATGLLSGEQNTLLTVLPAVLAAVGLAGAVPLAARIRRRARSGRARHARIAAAAGTLADAVERVGHVLSRRSGFRSVGGAVAYLLFDVLVLFFAFRAIGAEHAPSFGVVVMAYIIGALGGSIPLPAAIGTVGGMVGMFIVYGVARDTAVAAVLLYQAVGLLVPLIGGSIAYLLLRRELSGKRAAQ